MNINLHLELTLSIAVSIGGFVIWRRMKKIQRVRIEQTADDMEGVRGIKLDLDNGNDLVLKDVKVIQEAEKMKDVTGMEVNIKGTQSVRLQDVTIEQPGGRVWITDDPDSEVIINSQK